jgi:hypothetical protein
MLVAGLMMLGIVGAGARPAWHLWRTSRHDLDEVEQPPAGYANDASRMNLTAVREVRTVPADTAEAERELAALIKEANALGWKVSLAGARHSMGGHTIYPDGVVIDMRPLAAMRLDKATGVLHSRIWMGMAARSPSCSRTTRLRLAGRSAPIATGGRSGGHQFRRVSRVFV